MILKSIKTGAVAAILFGSTMIASAQKTINEGTITYGVTYTLSPAQAEMAAQLPKEQKVKFNGNIMRIDMQQGPATIVSLQDFAAKNGVTLIDVPIIQKQFAVVVTNKDFLAQEAANSVFTDFKATGEKQKVGNYNAEKYTYKDDKGNIYELWATNEIALPAGISGSQFNTVKGALVKYTTFQNGIKMTLTVKDINEGKVGPFSLAVPSGYELKTMQEMMQMQGGGE